MLSFLELSMSAEEYGLCPFQRWILESFYLSLVVEAGLEGANYRSDYAIIKDCAKRAGLDSLELLKICLALGAKLREQQHQK